MPRRRAWYATPCAWLPAEQAITPRFFSSALSEESLLNAPRSLNDAVNWWFSNLSQTSAPVISESVRECRNGVRMTCPSIVCAAFSMSCSVTMRSHPHTPYRHTFTPHTFTPSHPIPSNPHTPYLHTFTPSHLHTLIA